MTAELRTFAFEGRSLRIVLKESIPWWVATEVGAALGMKGDGNDLTKHLDEDERGPITIRTPGGPQRVTGVSESGLYALIFKSRKPEAKRFRKWVTAEVLPALRRTGRYEASPKAQGWVCISEAARRVGFTRTALTHRVERHGLPCRRKKGHLEVDLAAIQAHVARMPLRLDTGRAGLRHATFPEGLPEGVTMRDVIDAYGADAPAALYRMNPRIFPHPSTLKGGAR